MTLREYLYYSIIKKEINNMPTFDVVSEIDMHEMTNAVDQAQREITNRFDFKGVEATFELSDSDITIGAEVDFQPQQMLCDITFSKDLS